MNMREEIKNNKFCSFLRKQTLGFYLGLILMVGFVVAAFLLPRL